MEVTAQVTEMDNPIGMMFGNSHEIVECIDCLKGEGPNDTMELVYSQADALGFDIRQSINNGRALEEFKEMCSRQGVATEVILNLVEKPWSVLPRASQTHEIMAPKSGWVAGINALTIGQVLCNLGAGRTGDNIDIDHGIGAELLVSPGQEIAQGMAWIRFDTNTELSPKQVQLIENSLQITDEVFERQSRILQIITA
jgi:thymidine phosphorylase